MGNRIQGKIEQIKTFDCFPAPISLYHQSETESKSCFGGIITYLLLAFLVFVFYQSFSTLFASNLEVMIKLDMETSPSNVKINITSFYFVVGVTNLQTFQANPSYLEYELIKTRIVKGNQQQTTILMEKCRLDIFSQLYPNFQQFFYGMKFNMLLCLPENENLVISGSPYTETFEYLTFRVKGCGSNCVNNSQYSKFYQQKTSIQTVNFFFINKLAQFRLKNPMELYIEDKIFDFVVPHYFKRIDLYLTQYSIETEDSYMKVIFSRKKPKLTGILYNGKISKKIQKIESLSSSPRNLQYQIFVEYNLLKDPEKLYIYRSHAQVDNMLAYIGGLVGIVMIIFGWFVRKFNKFVFEQSVANRIFKKNQVQQDMKNVENLEEQRESKLALFLSHSFFSLLDEMCPSNSCRQANENHSKLVQIQQMLNSQIFFQSLLVTDNILKICLTEQQICLLLCQEKPCILKDKHNEPKEKIDEEDIVESAEKDNLQLPEIDVPNEGKAENWNICKINKEKSKAIKLRRRARLFQTFLPIPKLQKMNTTKKTVIMIKPEIIEQN